MSSLITLSKISKQHGSQLLFNELSCSINEKERIGIVGPNGAGKSTLMKILAGLEEIDSGDIIRKKDLEICYTAQSANFNEEKSIYQYVLERANKHFPFEEEAERVARSSLAKLKFENFELIASELSGGQKKRLQLALALCSSPELLILDEPTNHLDVESILILEQLLNDANFAWIVVSHDRWFLEQTAKKMIEVNKYYPNGIFECSESYNNFINRREEFMQAEEKRISSLANVARREQAWLRKGPKARSTKAKHRIDSANEIIENVSKAKTRTRARSIDISFTSSDRKTKRLIELKNVSKSFESINVLEKLSTVIVSGQVIGILGRNGSGKTTLINLLTSKLEPDSGRITPTTGVEIAHFEQFSKEVDPDKPLKEVLCNEGDGVVYKGNVIHVASWAKKFSFAFEQLNQPYKSLSGGEKARARIANLMLSTADVLILDEPTNDLDIETLEVLEESLLEFKGAIILVTHDRYMISRLCTHFIALNGNGAWQNYADYEQWQKDILIENNKAKKTSKKAEKSSKPKTKLSYNEQREYSSMEKNIAKAEEKIASIQKELEVPEADLVLLCDKLALAQEKVDQFYQRWEELEEMIKSFNS